MDSYLQPHPFHGNHIHYPHHYYPSWEAFPPQMAVDPAKQPLINEPVSYGYRYSHPNQSHRCGCCSSMYPPGYYSFRPPHPYPPSYPPPYYHEGPHPPHPEILPCYRLPYSYYPIEHQRFEYDKDMPGKHCSCCPNHAWNQKQVKGDNKGVRIEEHDTETENKGSGSSGRVNLESNHPVSPFEWIPPEFFKDINNKNARRKPSDLYPSGWFPFRLNNDDETGKPFVFPLDSNNIKSLKQGEDGKKNEIQLSEDKEAPPSSTLIPPPDKPEDAKECNSNAGSTLETPAKYKIIPINSVDEDQGDGRKVLENLWRNGVGSTTRDNKVEPKNATAEQIGKNGMGSAHEKERKVKNIPVKQAEENEKKTENKSVKKQSSPPKVSKLPPVCLRVDPLPKRKNGNSTSRSPSTPGLRAQQDSVDANNQSSVDKTLSQNSSVIEAAETHKKNETLVDAGVGKAEHDKEDGARIHDQSQVRVNTPTCPNDEFSSKETAVKGSMCEGGNKNEDCKGSVEVIEMKCTKEKKHKNEFSITEAAILIQSAYRGFLVRKWEPLKKLRQIARVREQVEDVKERVRALRTSVELRKDEKQATILSENIMTLLLQLDSIQGLHPSVRDARKSVARELACLQEELDSLNTPMPEETQQAHQMEDTAHGNRGAVETKNAGNGGNPCDVVDGTFLVSEVIDEESDQNVLETSDCKPDKHSPINIIDDMTVKSDSVESPNVIVGDGQQALVSMDHKPGVKKDSDECWMSHDDLNKVPEAVEDLGGAFQTVREVPESSEARQTPQAIVEGPESTGNTQMIDTKANTDVEELEGIDNHEARAVCELGVAEMSQIAETVEISHNETCPDTNLPAEFTLEVENKSSNCNSKSQQNLELESGKDEGSVPKDLLITPLVEDDYGESSLEVPQHNHVLAFTEEETLQEPPNEEWISVPVEPEGPVMVSPDDMAEVVLENKGCISEDTGIAYKGTTTGSSFVQEIEGATKTSISEETKASDTDKPVAEVATRERDTVASVSAIDKPVDDMAEVVLENKSCISEDTGIAYKGTTTGSIFVREIEGATKTPISEETKASDTDKPVAEVAARERATVGSVSAIDKPVDLSSAEGVNCSALHKPELGEINENANVLLVEENEKLRQMVEKLVNVGNQQLAVISDLNGRVKDIERKLVKKKKPRMRRPRTVAAGYLCQRQASDIGDKVVGRDA